VAHAGLAAAALVIADWTSPAPSIGASSARPAGLPPAGLQVRGARLVDGRSQPWILRGAQIAGLNVARPAPNERAAVAHLTARTFQVMHDGWHMNVLRLPVSDFLWRAHPSAYLATVARVVQTANAAGLVVIIDLHEDQRAGLSEHVNFRLPTPLAASFWRAVAARFRRNRNVVFDVYNEPSTGPPTSAHPGNRSADWTIWLKGGSVEGHRTVGMQQLVNVIRSVGARQVVVVEGLRVGQTLQGIGGHMVSGADIMYSVHPYFGNYSTSAAWDANFGFMATRVPLLAGEWGLVPNGYNIDDCLPVRPSRAPALIRSLLRYFEKRQISWIAFAFQVPKMIQSWTTYQPTTLDRPWACGERENKNVGMGAEVKAYLLHHPASGP
jgi:hypothetical protein